MKTTMNVSDLIRALIRDLRQGRRPVPVYQVVSKAVETVLAEAYQIKSDAVRAQVVWCLVCGVENADDTNDFASEKAKGYVSEENANDYWHYIFRASTQSMSCEREIGKQARIWLNRRHLAG